MQRCRRLGVVLKALSCVSLRVGRRQQFRGGVGARKMCSLADLRAKIAEKGVDVFIVPTNDPHFCEMPPQHFARREFVSGFTGSAGTAVVFSRRDLALLWTDGRYYIQAAQELSKEWTLMKGGSPGVPTMEAWLKGNVNKGEVVGVDPTVFSIADGRRLEDALKSTGVELKLLSENPVDEVWTSGRDALSDTAVRLHPLKFAGAGVQDKLKKISHAMMAQQADLMLITKLDEIAWLLNIRGNDVPNSPLFVSYLTVQSDAVATLYADPTRLTPSVGASLSAALVTIRDYEQAIEDVRLAAQSGKKVWLDPTCTSLAALVAAKAGDSKDNHENDSKEQPQPLITESPVALAKAVKNEAELNAMRAAFVKDGVNWARFLCWLEEAMANGEKLSEVDVSEALEKIRRENDSYLEASFETIAAAGANGAVIHYRPEKGKCAMVTPDASFLCDAGCQFEEGTTDITRTMHFGKPTDWQRECFTRVLKGHIAIDESVFPEGTSGFLLDAFARRALWSAGLDYRHGTGHGVGAALCVHEGPQMISFRGTMVPLEPGMILSNEPGYYEQDNFGIRIESCVAVRRSERLSGFLEFEPLTFVPLQTRMIDVRYLTDAECDWVDQYHSQVFSHVASHLKEDKVKTWLSEATRPLDRMYVGSFADRKHWLQTKDHAVPAEG